MKKKQKQSFSIVTSLMIGFLSLAILFPSQTVSKDEDGRNKAILTVNSFERGGDGGGPSECDGKFHSNNDPIVALSTQWYKKGKRCEKYIDIFVGQGGGSKKVRAKVVDECDTKRGCPNNIVDGSKAVWKALGQPTSIGRFPVYWTDA